MIQQDIHLRVNEAEFDSDEFIPEASAAKEKKTPVPAKVAAKAIGYAGLSGPSRPPAN
jgi:hypothetical protein